MATGVGWM